MPRGNRAPRATPSPECRNDPRPARDPAHPVETDRHPRRDHRLRPARPLFGGGGQLVALGVARSEEHTSELQSLMRISYAVFCLKKKTKNKINNTIITLHTRCIKTTH